MSDPGASGPGVLGVLLRPMRWWDVAPAAAVEQVLFGATAWTPELFWSELAAPGRWYLAAVPDPGGHGDAGGPGHDSDGQDLDDRGPDGEDVLLGYAGLAVAGADADVQTLAVAPGAQGRGLGRALLGALVERARAGRATSLLLEVRADNAPAQALYASCGFTRIGVRRRYYQPGDVDALVLRRRLR